MFWCKTSLADCVFDRAPLESLPFRIAILRLPFLAAATTHANRSQLHNQMDAPTLLFQKLLLGHDGEINGRESIVPPAALVHGQALAQRLHGSQRFASVDAGLISTDVKRLKASKVLGPFCAHLAQTALKRGVLTSMSPESVRKPIDTLKGVGEHGNHPAKAANAPKTLQLCSKDAHGVPGTCSRIQSNRCFVRRDVDIVNYNYLWPQPLRRSPFRHTNCEANVQ
eukprot:CAMPEP_0204200378 /NCGR_PEP_ID=MMETSP0361-20130328/66678_1 /ASSEMBLY_ACC=CAM_ASM_000343 /TAXON_ID=268821 /ORGANISM="Scrippsiella Hangoei, Strain SHTV-5" /LENGTH=224 /DNA_ID=CAMNT_0051162811 /DNA_START=1073 /DNA_END=1747 /DNA_ORIENTATION=-